jgi:predicted transcriptional regulator
MSRPSDTQGAALNLAHARGYVRPASPRHARDLGTSSQALTRTVKSCVGAGWLRHDVGGRYVLTPVGAAFFAGAVQDF